MASEPHPPPPSIKAEAPPINQEVPQKPPRCKTCRTRHEGDCLPPCATCGKRHARTCWYDQDASDSSEDIEDAGPRIDPYADTPAAAYQPAQYAHPPGQWYPQSYYGAPMQNVVPAIDTNMGLQPYHYGFGGGDY